MAMPIFGQHFISRTEGHGELRAYCGTKMFAIDSVDNPVKELFFAMMLTIPGEICHVPLRLGQVDPRCRA